ncbi:cellulose binding domain-containing protein [Nonomuraea salmonea]|uniref:cellulose binding domain-containing protein n=1 Tax=Nonomuraea salmonea TaxID=46181 RepID=UPI0031EEE2E4
MTAASVAALGLVAGQSTAANAAVACDVTYTANSWTSSPGQGGFTANITLKNTGDPISSWTLAFDYPTTNQKYTPQRLGRELEPVGRPRHRHQHAVQRQPGHRRVGLRRLQRHLDGHEPQPGDVLRQRHHLR